MKRLLFGVSIIDIRFWESFEALVINSEIILVFREFWKNSSYFFLVVGDMFGNFRESYCFFNLDIIFFVFDETDLFLLDCHEGT